MYDSRSPTYCMGHIAWERRGFSPRLKASYDHKQKAPHLSSPPLSSMHTIDNGLGCTARTHTVVVTPLVDITPTQHGHVFFRTRSLSHFLHSLPESARPLWRGGNYSFSLFCFGLLLPFFTSLLPLRASRTLPYTLTHPPGVAALPRVAWPVACFWSFAHYLQSLFFLPSDTPP